MAETTDADGGVAEELAVAIATRRGGAGAGEMARRLLARDAGGYLLVGLTADAERAVFYEPAMYGLTRVPFDADGPDGGRVGEVERLDRRGAVEGYVREHADAFGWVHPRFRWVLE